MSDPTKGPALPTTPTSASLVPTLRATYLDTSLPLFTRYRAMFSLRNVSPPTQESVEALADGFGDKSALFRHEIAYVFGQLSSKWSVKSLVERLSDENECEGGIASEGEGQSLLVLLPRRSPMEKIGCADVASFCS
jgi:deoxyhypusine monooxygenase